MVFIFPSRPGYLLVTIPRVLVLLVSLLSSHFALLLFSTKASSKEKYLHKFTHNQRVKTNLASKQTNTATNDVEDYLLEGQNLVKVYGAGVKDGESSHALDDVTFLVASGALLGLVGKSSDGIGKVSALTLLCYLLFVCSFRGNCWGWGLLALLFDTPFLRSVAFFLQQHIYF